MTCTEALDNVAFMHVDSAAVITLRALRHRLGWSLADLAKRTGLHASTISRLETGETQPTYETVLRLQDAMGIKPGTPIQFGAPDLPVEDRKDR